MNKNKILLFTISLAILSFSTAAQSGPSVDSVVGSLGQGIESIKSAYGDYSGADLGNLPAIQFAGAVSLIFLLIHVSLSKVLEFAGMKDMFVDEGRGTDDGSKTKLYLLSILFWFTFLGTGTLAAQTIVLVSAYIWISVFGGVVLIGLLAARSSGGIVKGGLIGAKGVSRSAKAKASSFTSDKTNKYKKEKSALDQSEKELNQVSDVVKDIGQKAKEIAGYDLKARLKEEDIKDEEQEIEIVLKKLENTEEEVEYVEEELKAILDQLEQFETAELQDEEEIGNEMKDSIEWLERLERIFSDGNWSAGNHKDLKNKKFGEVKRVLSEVKDAVTREAQLNPIILEAEDIEKKIEEIEESFEEDLKVIEKEISDLSEAERLASEKAEDLKDREDYQRLKGDLNETGNVERRLKDTIKAIKSLEEESKNAKKKLTKIVEAHETHANYISEIEEKLIEIKKLWSNERTRIQTMLGLDGAQGAQVIDNIDDLIDLVDSVNKDVRKAARQM